MYVDRFKLFWLIRPNFRLAHEVLQKFDVTKTKTIYFWRDISNISGIFSLKKSKNKILCLNEILELADTLSTKLLGKNRPMHEETCMFNMFCLNWVTSRRHRKYSKN